MHGEPVKRGQDRSDVVTFTWTTKKAGRWISNELEAMEQRPVNTNV